ncbi:MAG TPA: carboxypeptidase-like regulatory domain-containing protein [Methanocella sp.]|nr:carboxypeptidase-like regulatory domain-containing protein [Methanocella sp.]
MKSVSLLIVLAVSIMLLGIVTLAPSFAQATPAAVNASISGKVSSSTGVSINGTQVMLVNASNTSEAIDNFTMQVGTDGFYQFTNVPAGNFSVFAWAPMYSTGISNPIETTGSVSYTANVVLEPEPYYVDIQTSSTSIPLETGKATVTFTIYDYWMKKIGKGWFITTYSTQGQLDPLYGYTNDDSQFVTTLSAPMEGNMTTINISAKALNGTYYPLQMAPSNTTATTVPFVSPSPNATVNATATPQANATGMPSRTATATAASSPTTVPTPGFEIIAALGGIGLAVAYRKLR